MRGDISGIHHFQLHTSRQQMPDQRDLILDGVSETVCYSHAGRTGLSQRIVMTAGIVIPPQPGLTSKPRDFVENRYSL